MTATDAVVRFFLDVDRRDWAELRASLTDVVDTDYSSLAGGSPEQVAAEVLLDRWRALLPGFDATQHVLGPLAPVAGDASGERLECNVRAYHRLAGAEDGDEWIVAGRYVIAVRREAERWKVAAITLDTAYQAGNLDLPDLASARAAGRG